MPEYHMLPVAVAAVIGMKQAALLENIHYWCTRNAEEGRHFHDGRYWTYSSASALAKRYPYLTLTTIKRTLKALEKSGYIVTGRYNAHKYDHTTWYAMTEKGMELMRLRLDTLEEETRSKMDHPKSKMDQGRSKMDRGDDVMPVQNGPTTVQNGPTIPLLNTIPLEEEPFSNKEPSNSLGQLSLFDKAEVSDKPEEEPQKPKRKSKPKAFVPPTVDEVREYCEERGNGIDPQYFVDYYAANDWCDSKGNPVKSWKQRVLSWEGREKSREAKNKHQVGSWDY